VDTNENTPSECSVNETTHPDEGSHVDHVTQSDQLCALSKNQQKRLLKAQRWEKAKQLKKERKKQQAKDNRPEKRKFEELEENGHEEATSANIERQARKEQANADFLKKCDDCYGVIIDCGWEDDHTDSTLKSLTQQIMYCYGINNRSEHPSYIYVTGIGPRTSEKLKKNHCENWRGVSLHSSDYSKLFVPESAADDSSGPIGIGAANGGKKCAMSKELVYLTSDSTETLEDLDDNCVYIIGGIVDRNRLKGATYNKAQKQGIRTAKLPIKEHCKMSATHVLTINHVFDILKSYSSCKSWATAMEKVLPSRKGATVTDSSSQQDKDTESC